MAFWVHFYELPMELFNASMAARLRNAIGRFEEYDNDGRNFGWKKSMRVRVTLDITKPLRRCIKVNLDEPLGRCWTPIRYEKLPDLCGYCGIIGHGVKDCNSCYLAAGSPYQCKQYGMWLQYTGRTTTLFRSPSNSLLSKNKIMVDHPAAL